jgi:hypothetical protein
MQSDTPRCYREGSPFTAACHPVELAPGPRARARSRLFAAQRAGTPLRARGSRLFAVAVEYRGDGASLASPSSPLEDVLDVSDVAVGTRAVPRSRGFRSGARFVSRGDARIVERIEA